MNNGGAQGQQAATPPQWQIASLKITLQESIYGGQTSTWSFTDVVFDISQVTGVGVPGTYYIECVPTGSGSFSWVDQPEPGCGGYSGGPIALPSVCVGGTISDDPIDGFVITDLEIIPYPLNAEQSATEYSVACDGSTETRQMFPAVVPPLLISGTDSPFQLQAQLKGSNGSAIPFHFERTDGDSTMTADGTLKPVYSIQVTIDPPTLSPLTSGTTSTVTVTALVGGLPDRDEQIQVKACTDIGGPGPDDDGHLHDSRSDPCDQSAGSRPVGVLQDPGTTSSFRNPPPSYYPLSRRTDKDGKVTLSYTPPQSPNPPSNNPGYVSGNDVISAWLYWDSSMEDERGLTTRVSGLSPMPGSADCSGGSSAFTSSDGAVYQAYVFISQSNHGCQFYGTAATNQSLVSISSAFISAQIACANGTDSSFGQNQNGQNFTTPLPPQPVQITAMSLPWGGLLDIKGDWNPPHSTHNNGTMADLALYILPPASPTATSGWDMDRILLLKAMIMKDPNYGSLVMLEGGDLGTANLTLQPPQPGKSTGPHIHVNFKS